MKTNISKSDILSRVKIMAKVSTDTELADFLGINKSTLSNWKTRGTIDYDLVFSKCENINYDWLLTGNGDMIRQSDTQLASIEVSNKFTLRTDRDIDIQRVPLYDIEATAGIVSLFTDTFTQVPGCYLSIPDMPPCDGAIRVVGNSMYPIIRAGDIVLFKQIHNIETSIIWGEMYLIAFNIEGDEYLMVKYLKKGSNDNSIMLVSENPAYDPMEIPISSIRALAIVKASVRYNTMM